LGRRILARTFKTKTKEIVREKEQKINKLKE
jgi:hypothetical protein